jgi:hypothetical protein
MKIKTQFATCILLSGLCFSSAFAQQQPKGQAPPSKNAGTSATAAPQVESIPAPQPVQTPKPITEPGFMEPAAVKALLHKIWITEYRVNDLLAQVHPEKWKTSDAGRKSFGQTLENLHKVLDALDAWRGKFEDRPESMYLGFQTYTAIDAALPRLDGVARSISQFENRSLGVQYSQAGNQLFDLQQALQPYIAYLLRTPDEMLFAAQSNLARCQGDLGNALRGQGGPATPLKNTFVEFHGRRHGQDKAGSQKPAQGVEKKAVVKSETKPQAKPEVKKTPSK